MLDTLPTSVPTTHDARAPQPKLFAPGVYFGLDFEAYHADPALGSGDMRALVQSPADYWWQSKHNPNRAVRDSDAMLWGRAFHALVLEGATAYSERFATEPSADAIPGVLVTQDDLKARLKELDLPVSGSKAEQTKRLRTKDTSTPVWDEIISAFREGNAAHGRVALKAKMAAEIKTAADFLNKNGYLARAFQGGVAEVSIFWVESGVRMKCRLDYLKPQVALDLKSIANQSQRPLDEAIKIEIAGRRLDIQAVHNMNGYCALLDHAEEGRVFGESPLGPDFWKVMASPAVVRWTWVFVQRTGAPVSRAVEVAPGSDAFEPAVADIARALIGYKDAMARFGTAGPWIDESPISSLTLGDLPRWLSRSASEVSGSAVHASEVAA